MRTEKQMYDLILRTAQEDERILAVYMNGSRTNINVSKDIFCDYDVVYVVTETESFRKEKEWISVFGEILYMQYPDENPEYLSDIENFYGWLMQFKDGNRIDLHVESLTHAKEHIKDDKLCEILLDKGNYLPQIEPATDQDYYIKRPTESQYHCTCNEFWWCTNNLAKGMWRSEMPYVQDMTNFHVRKQLEKMLLWKIGILTNYSLSAGKSAKYMYRWLTKEEWNQYLSTYFGGKEQEAWIAIETMCSLFSRTAKWVGNALEFSYHETEDINATAFLTRVRQLPKNAKEI